ncbi:MAG: NAD(P)-dependent oxidoreductase [Verrucomicrobiae bacterium]|nr:NAD(P)-dependent oxidoreductase [Verrucomicrobiae bacterium]
MKTRVLLTGGAGYIGSVLCEHLLGAGCAVTVLDNIMYGQTSLFHFCSNPDFDFVFGDARDERLLRELVPKHDVLIPLACIVGAPACDRDPILAQSVNVDAIALLNRLRSASQLVVYPTTNSGYGTKSGEVYCTEETPLEPISLYGVTKAKAEELLLNSPNAISLRLATVFGMSPRMRLDLLVNHFVYAAVTDRYLVVFEKDFKRNYVHIRDVADCFLHCIGNADRMVGRCFNVGLDSANLSKAELAMKIKEHVPDFYVHFAEVGCDPDRRNYIVSNQRLREAGFEAKRTLDDGIRELIKGYRMLKRMPFRNV